MHLQPEVEVGERLVLPAQREQQARRGQPVLLVPLEPQALPVPLGPEPRVQLVPQGLLGIPALLVLLGRTVQTPF